MGENGAAAFTDFSGNLLQARPPMEQGRPGSPADAGAQIAGRVPVFDISVRAQKHSPFARISQNELAKEFYQMGFFDPARASEALACMEMMDFEGKGAVMERIRAAAFPDGGTGANAAGTAYGGMRSGAAGLSRSDKGAGDPLRAAVLRSAAMAEGKER